MKIKRHEEDISNIFYTTKIRKQILGKTNKCVSNNHLKTYSSVCHYDKGMFFISAILYD